MTDLENILQQYGEDKRQQQNVSDTLHGIARRQRRRLLMACSVLLIATTVWSIYKLTSPHQNDAVIIAQQENPTTTQSHNQETTHKSPSTLTHHETKHPTTAIYPTSKPVQESDSQQSDATIHLNEPDLSPIATNQQLECTDSTQHETTPPQNLHQPIIQQFDNKETFIADNHLTIPSDNEGNRFRFTASIGASAMPRIGNSTTGDIVIQNGNNSIDESQNIQAKMTPIATLAANVGVNYSILLGKQHGLEVGVGLSGYSHQGEITVYDIGTSFNSEGIVETTYSASNHKAYNTFSLYASLPLTFILKTPKANDLGWNMSITPSHSLISSRTIGINGTNKPIINPWRLTLGLGLTFKRGLVRHMSVTANLLPLYTSTNLHEFGIEIGF